MAEKVYTNPGHEHDGMHLVHGLCLMPTGKKHGDYQRIGHIDFLSEKFLLFESGLEVQMAKGR